MFHCINLAAWKIHCVISSEGVPIALVFSGAFVDPDNAHYNIPWNFDGVSIGNLFLTAMVDIGVGYAY